MKLPTTNLPKLPTASAVLSLLALTLPLTAQSYESSDSEQGAPIQQQDPSLSQGMQHLMQGEFDKALPLLERAAANGDAMAQYAAAKLIRRGYGTTADTRRATSLLEKATQGRRFPEALVELSDLLVQGNGDPKRALGMLKQAAACGDADALLNLGNAHFMGRHVEKDLVKAFAYYSRAADMKQRYAIQNIAGVSKMMSSAQIDKGKALAAELRKQPSYDGATIRFQFDLRSAVMTAFSKGKKAYEARRLDEARQRLEPLARAGHPGSLFYVARMHETGRGYAKDMTEAARIYNVACQQGEGTSLGNLARLYKNGLGVAKSMDTAVDLWRVACWRGDVDAQNDYALACIQGQGTERDPIQAYVWWTIAAENGKKQAKNNLEILLSQDLPQSRRADADKMLAEVRKQIAAKFTPRAPFLKLDRPRLLEPQQPKRRSYTGSDDNQITKTRRSYGDSNGGGFNGGSNRGSNGGGDKGRETKNTETTKLEPFKSRDGKVTLLKPRNWKAETGAMFGEGTYSVSVDNADESAGILFVVIPGAARQFRNSKQFADKFIQGISEEFENLRVRDSISSRDGSKTRIDASFTEDGKRTVGVFQFTLEDGDARVMGMGAHENKWKTMQPMLQKMALSLRYPAQGGNGGYGQQRGNGGYGNQGYGQQGYGQQRQSQGYGNQGYGQQRGNQGVRRF